MNKHEANAFLDWLEADLVQIEYEIKNRGILELPGETWVTAEIEAQKDRWPWKYTFRRSGDYAVVIKATGPGYLAISCEFNISGMSELVIRDLIQSGHEHLIRGTR